MKKYILIILLLFPMTVFADKTKVEFFKCVDGDTARFVLNKKEVKIRFLGINAPEIEKDGKQAEAYGKEASNYTCRRLKNAKKIEIEYEKESDKKDKYDRLLAYVFVDDKLLEKDILKKGYANVKYIKKSYKYYDELVKAEETAKEKKLGLYSNEDYDFDKDDDTKIVKSIIKSIKKVLSNVLREIFD